MLEKKSKLSDDDFIESVIRKVRRHERRKKLSKAVVGGVAFFGVILFAGLQSVTRPENTVDIKSFDAITGDLMQLNEVDLDFQDDYAFNAGKPCLDDLACENC